MKSGLWNHRLTEGTHPLNHVTCLPRNIVGARRSWWRRGRWWQVSGHCRAVEEKHEESRAEKRDRGEDERHLWRPAAEGPWHPPLGGVDVTDEAHEELVAREPPLSGLLLLALLLLGKPAQLVRVLGAPGRRGDVASVAIVREEMHTQYMRGITST